MAKALTVLVVDDDELMLDLAVAALDSLGFGRISAALSGEQGLRVLDEFGADVVLCDLNMPEMDGVEFLRHLSARRYDGCIVLMSGEDQRILRTAESLAKAHGLNVLGACEKPISAAVLAQMRGYGYGLALTRIRAEDHRILMAFVSRATRQMEASPSATPEPAPEESLADLIDVDREQIASIDSATTPASA